MAVGLKVLDVDDGVEVRLWVLDRGVGSAVGLRDWVAVGRGEELDVGEQQNVLKNLQAKQKIVRANVNVKGSNVW